MPHKKIFSPVVLIITLLILITGTGILLLKSGLISPPKHNTETQVESKTEAKNEVLVDKKEENIDKHEFELNKSEEFQSVDQSYLFLQMRKLINYT